jgi:hypothetical protein
MNKSFSLIILAASLFAAPLNSHAQTNPDPWFDVFNGPHAQTLAILMQHGNISIFDPDFGAKIQALGPSVQVVDVPMGHNFFQESFSSNAAVDNHYYDLFDFRRTDPRVSFGTGPLSKWSASPNAGNPPVILNVDGNGPLGKDYAPSAWHGYWGYDDWKWFAYNEYDALNSTGGHYATNLKFDNTVKMRATFIATCTGNAKFSGFWSAWDAGGIRSSNSDYPGTAYEPRNALPAEIKYSIWEIPVPAFPQSGYEQPQYLRANAQTSTITNSGGNTDWTNVSKTFAVTAGKTYMIELDLSNGSPTYQYLYAGGNRAVDEIQVTNLQNCYKTIVNPFYKPTGTTLGGLDLSNVTEVQYTGFVRPIPFDPATTIYFPPTDPQIGAGPCCGPFSEETIPQLLTPTFPNGGASDFTMAYTPASSLDAQMAAYLNYVHSQDPSITTISINYSVASLGTGASAAAYGPFVTAAPNKTVTWKWTPTGVTNNATSFWSGTPFAIGTWYGVMTTISHNGSVSSPFFNANCIQNWWRFRAQGTMRLGKPTSNVVSFDTIGSANRVVSAPARPVLAGERLRVPPGDTRGIQGR